jgi:hypothetical protein
VGSHPNTGNTLRINLLVLVLVLLPMNLIN